MKKSYFYPVLMVAGVFAFSSCNSADDVYDPNYMQNQAKEKFPVENVDPNHTWEMSSLCSASVLVKEESGAVYTIKVYTANPFNVSSNAYLLAKKSVANGQTLNFKFDVPSALPFVYVVKENSNGYRSMKPVAVEDGKIDVTFGGEVAAYSAGTRAMATRVNTWIPQVPELTNTDIFPTEAPKTLYPTHNYWTNIQGNYLVTPDYTEINYQGNGGGIYIQGNVTLTSLYLGANCNLYLLPGSMLTLSGGYSIAQANCVLSVGENAIFNTGGDLSISNNAGIIYNAGKVNATGLLNSGTSPFYNLGTLELTAEVKLSGCKFYNSGIIDGVSINDNGNTNIINEGEIVLTGQFSCENAMTVAVNSGKITAGSFGLKGGSSFYNEDTGEVYISDVSAISSNSSTWDNAGNFKTKTMTFVSASQSWINRCKLYVDELLSISTNANAIFSVDGGAYVECGSLYMNMAEVHLGEKSFFNVLGTAEFGYNKEGGFKAIGSDYSLLKMGKAVRGSSTNNIAYSGKLYIDCVDHFDIQLDQWNIYYTLGGGAAFTGADNAEIEIPASECSPGYKPGPGEIGDDPSVYTYAFEDMTKEVGDYDYNDVILHVTTPIEGKIKISLVAAGASKNLKVLLNKDGINEVIFEEVHAALGASAGTLVNTGGGQNAEIVTIEMEVTAEFSLTENGDFYIHDGQGEVHIPKFDTGFKAGNVPYAVCIPAKWKYPKEYISVEKAYDKFADWAQDATQEPDWYNEPNAGEVY